MPFIDGRLGSRYLHFLFHRVVEFCGTKVSFGQTLFADGQIAVQKCEAVNFGVIYGQGAGGVGYYV